MTYDENPTPRAAKPKKPVPDNLAFCKECGRWPRLTNGGNLAQHDYPTPWDPDDATEKSGRCPGSGRKAATSQPELPLGGGPT